MTEEKNQNTFEENTGLDFEHFTREVLADYKIASLSREVSLLGRREVLTGKAKFGIFGDGKEVAQVAMAKFFKPGDFRSGYYRDQTFMFSSGLATVEQFFAQLYADPDVNNDPFSGGRQMNAHFATQTVDANGNWLPLSELKNVSSDISPTAGQMPRALGLAYASRFFRKVPEVSELTSLSNNGNEVCFCTIGDASTSEGHFWETMNAAGVLQVPLAVFVWDDGYGISVPKKYQTTKASISEALAGLQKQEGTNGIDIYKLKGWDYAGMCEVLEPAIQRIRDTHTPALFHVEEVTQPQGHSTSGSHERYKNEDRLGWEKEWDCLAQMRNWILENSLATEEQLTAIEENSIIEAREGKQRAWENYLAPIIQLRNEALAEMSKLNLDEAGEQKLNELKNLREPARRDILKTLAWALNRQKEHSQEKITLNNYYQQVKAREAARYDGHLYAENNKSALKVPEIKADFGSEEKTLNGYEILNNYFNALFENNNKVAAFGEDLGYIGDVNQGFMGLQEKYGAERIFDTGIRELTIIGQGIGMALRGLRPIAEIQYLDYLLYGLQPLSDDVATTHYRTHGRQSCPLIVRTRGHRLEGIWHSGSPMAVILGSLRGMFVCVPRNMVQAAGMYNTLLKGNDPGLVIECLNGYRLKEKLPVNLLEYTVPLGVPEIIREGEDITVVSYGSTLRIIQEAAEHLSSHNGVECEIIDVQTLLPFDLHHKILDSLKKTSRIVFIDEDVPGGAAAYMYNKVMEEQGGYRWVDASPRTITAKPHRPGYGSDGDYFSKPNAEDVIFEILEIMAE